MRSSRINQAFQLKLDLPPEFAGMVLKRPGMYFGFTGPRAIPRIIMNIVRAVLQVASNRGNYRVDVSMGKKEQIITFHGLSEGQLDPKTFARWLKDMSDPQRGTARWDALSEANRDRNLALFDVMHAALASENFDMSQRSRTTSSRVVCKGGRLTVSGTTNSKTRKPLLQIRIRQHKSIFQEPGETDMYSVAGALRDVSILRPGLTTRLTFQGGDYVQHFYKRGLESALLEEDHSRWPIYEGILKAAASRDAMRFECCIRFLHSGQPRIRSWVNYLPTQGGSHVRAVARALSELFSDYDKGCRTLPLMVDTDDMGTIMLPRAFVGLLHVETDCARYKGPTKDVLDVEEVESFVYTEALKQFRSQWEKLKNQRAL